MNIRELQRLLRKCWMKETSADPNGWTPENPAWGQCAVTSLVVQDLMGGELTRASLEDVQGFEFMRSHYWNTLPDGEQKDLSKSQFPNSAYKTIPEGQTKDRETTLSYEPTRKRFAILRLAVENEINPNPLYADDIYRRCFEMAQTSDCQKMRFGCVVMFEGREVAADGNRSIEPLKHLCKPTCIRFEIKSRTESMIGACGHAEEWAKEAVPKDIPLDECSLYVAGFQMDNTPWIKKRPEHTCLRCATQMFIAKIGKVYVPVIDRWEALTTEEALKTAIAYALPEQAG